SLVARDDVPLAKSCDSSNTTEKPRAAASSATPRPVAPPPMTARSKVLDSARRASNWSRPVFKGKVFDSTIIRHQWPGYLVTMFGAWRATHINAGSLKLMQRHEKIRPVCPAFVTSPTLFFFVSHVG